MAKAQITKSTQATLYMLKFIRDDAKIKMKFFIQYYFATILIYLIAHQHTVDAFPLTTTWNEGKLHFVNYADNLRGQDSLYDVKWNYNYERYARKLAMRCGDENEKIETLLDTNIYTSIMNDLNWIDAYQEWEESKPHGNIFPRSNLDTPAYVGCASETCGTQTYHVCTFNHYFLRNSFGVY
ncbi:hypothetical protein K501DRAFT_330591 [Backusella circina FSU 941]|nr:hypothetical protein K501DRAFT_338749 [Backusella circina FSU 941]KAI8887348.1 hypothetical protein K501DRAFT_330591 [Backusella circina FSU 941]